MNRHIAGFILFSFIIGTTAFIYAMFSVITVREVSALTYSPAKSCWKMKREIRESNIGSPVISQAVLDLKTKQLSWKLAAPKTDSSIALHFFVKDEKGTRFIASELALGAGYGSNAKKFTSSYLWLDKLGSYNNLYVIAEPISIFNFKNKKVNPKFDASKAAPVLLYSGDQD